MCIRDRVRVFPKLLASSTHMFRYRACRFHHKESNPGCQIISNKFDIANSFIIQSSLHAFINKERKSVEFTCELYEKMGRCVADTLLDYCSLMEEEESSKLRRVFSLNAYGQEETKFVGNRFQAKKGVLSLQEIYRSIKNDSREESNSDESDVNEDPATKEEERKTLRTVIAAVSGFYKPENSHMDEDESRKGNRTMYVRAKTLRSKEDSPFRKTAQSKGNRKGWAETEPKKSARPPLKTAPTRKRPKSLVKTDFSKKEESLVMKLHVISNKKEPLSENKKSKSDILSEKPNKKIAAFASNLKTFKLPKIGKFIVTRNQFATTLSLLNQRDKATNSSKKKHICQSVKLLSKNKRNSPIMYDLLYPVSYTHLTLPTICSV
eukprot:TRINITY_DN13490_c0_g1_i7.p1 TRINITY_DN13490_c0_g1~~TRINITY_DN13490_c0_g1_i7.p1  ORF type:complete len:379 (+),score=58.42 TRINITY_DN13490_c0_g1_i7:73-1209(+)